MVPDNIQIQQIALGSINNGSCIAGTTQMGVLVSALKKVTKPSPPGAPPYHLEPL